MKRLSIVAISLVASLVLVGCGSSSSDSSSKSSGSSTATDKGNDTSKDSGSGTTTDTSKDTSKDKDTKPTPSGGDSITIGDDAKNVYGYKISGKLSQPNGVTSNVVTTFNCDGSHKSDQSVTLPNGHTVQADKKEGGADKAPTLSEGFGDTAGKTILGWTYDTETGGDSYILTDDKKIVVGVTRISGLKTSEVTKIEKVKECK